MASPFGSPGPAGRPVALVWGVVVGGAASGNSPGRVQLHPVGGKKPSLCSVVLKVLHGPLFALLKKDLFAPRLEDLRALFCAAVRTGPTRGQSRAALAWRSSSLSLCARLGSSKNVIRSKSCAHLGSVLGRAGAVAASPSWRWRNFWFFTVTGAVEVESRRARFPVGSSLSRVSRRAGLGRRRGLQPPKEERINC